MKLIVRIKKTVEILLIGVLTSVMLMGCGEQSKSEAQTKVNENLQKGFLEAGAETENYYGKITAIDGDTVTIAIAEEMVMGGPVPEDMSSVPEGNPPDGQGSQDKMTASGNESKPKMEQGDRKEGDIKLTGEEAEITIDDETTFEVEGAEATYGDLAVDDIVTAAMSGDKVISISKGIRK